jgi:transposase InsO family protein
MNGGRSALYMIPCDLAAALRALTIVDDCSRESLAIEVDTSLSGSRVTRVLDAIAGVRDFSIWP